MTKPKEGDQEEIKTRLLDACVGLPAKIPWPHRLLHDAVDHIKMLEERRGKQIAARSLYDKVLDVKGLVKERDKARREAEKLGKQIVALREALDGALEVVNDYLSTHVKIIQARATLTDTAEAAARYQRVPQ